MSTVSASSSLYAGIFSREQGQRFLQILVSLSDRGFEGLYRKCQGNVEGNYYQTGLRRVNAWSDAVIVEDIDFIKSVFPDLEETFETCFFNYVEDRYRGRHKAMVNTPNIVTFVRLYLESVGTQESLSNGDYFAKRDPVLKRITCMDAARTALFSLSNSEHVKVELLSEVSSVRQLAHTSQHELEKMTDVTPNDSVSQISVPRSRIEPRPPSVVTPRSNIDKVDASSNVHPPSPRDDVDAVEEEERAEQEMTHEHVVERAPSVVSKATSVKSRNQASQVEKDRERMSLPERQPSEISYRGPSIVSKKGYTPSEVSRVFDDPPTSDVFRPPSRPPTPPTRSRNDTPSVISRHDFDDRESAVMVERPEHSERPSERSSNRRDEGSERPSERTPLTRSEEPRRARSNVSIGIKRTVTRSP
jgi:hypothetical protein